MTMMEELDAVLAEIEKWRDRAKGLWQLLDDIDTASDSTRGDWIAYGNAVRELADMRHMYAVSKNGHTLEWK